jgi:cell division protein FtsW
MKLAVTTLVFCVAALLALGLVTLYSASMDKVGARFLLMQLVWGTVGIIACLVVASLDYRLLKRFAVPLLIFSAVLLALVLVPSPLISVSANGARRWLNLRIANFQPSEMAKLTLIVGLAWYVDSNARFMHTFRRGLVVPGIMIGVILALIFVEPDRGTTVLMGGVCGVMLLIAGVRLRYVLPVILALVPMLAYSLWNDPVRSKRIMAWITQDEGKSAAGFQAYQAMLALGSGGWSGLGLGNGRQKLGFVPERHTDFILSVIGEELGVIATLSVVVCFTLIFICGLAIARRARDTFGMMVATGISFLIGFQAFINIGVVTSALPNKGLSLPFISYGGSSLLMMLVCIGVLLSIARQVPASQPLMDDDEDTEVPATQIS